MESIVLVRWKMWLGITSYLLQSRLCAEHEYAGFVGWNHCMLTVAC
jgi:hypothetical protein